MSSPFVSPAGPIHLGKTVAVVVSLVVLGALLAGCNNSRADSDKSSGASTTKSGIDAEAQEQAEKYWGSLLTKCAGTIYGKDNRQAVDQIYEFRDSSIRIKPRVLSDADTMNGIEWSGDAHFDSKTSRVLTAKQWGAWRNGSILLNSQTMQKVNGEWKFGVLPDAPPPLRIFACSELP